MAKQTGLGDNFYLGGYDLSGNVSAVQSIVNKRALMDVTCINKSARERLSGMRDGSLSFNSFFDDLGAANRAGATGSPFLALSALPTADVVTMYFRGTTRGGESASLIGKQVDYAAQRSADGALGFTTEVQGNGYGLEWSKSLTPGKRQDTTATAAGAANSVDLVDVSTAFGCAAYLEVFSFTGTSVTIRIQDSADNAAFANITGLNAFTVVSAAPFAERIETDNLTRTIRRYVAVGTTGTFSECTFAVTFVRYYAANREI